MTCEERIFAIEHDWPDSAFDDVGVELDATVVEELNEPVPVVQAIAQILGEAGLAGDARQLMLKPWPERHDERLALLLARVTTLLGAHAADRLLDRIELGDPPERLAGDRRFALGVIEEPASQVRHQKASVIRPPGVLCDPAWKDDPSRGNVRRQLTDLRGIYDNMRTAVDKIGRGKSRQVNARFSAMVSHFLFEAEFCNPASG